jgi:hypothetical protein
VQETPSGTTGYLDPEADELSDLFFGEVAAAPLDTLLDDLQRPRRLGSGRGREGKGGRTGMGGGTGGGRAGSRGGARGAGRVGRTVGRASGRTQPGGGGGGVHLSSTEFANVVYGAKNSKSAAVRSSQSSKAAVERASAMVAVRPEWVAHTDTQVSRGGVHSTAVKRVERVLSAVQTNLQQAGYPTRAFSAAHRAPHRPPSGRPAAERAAVGTGNEEAAVQRVSSTTTRRVAANKRTTEVAFGRAVGDKPGAMPEAVRRRLERLEHEALVTVAERLIEEILTAGQVMLTAPTTTTKTAPGGGGGAGRGRGGGGGRGGSRARPTSGRGDLRQPSSARAQPAGAAGGDSSSPPAARAKKTASTTTTRARRLLSDSVELHSLVHLNQLQVRTGALTRSTCVPACVVRCVNSHTLSHVAGPTVSFHLNG